MTVRLRPAAIADLDDARQWYRRIDAWLAERFEEAVARTFDRIRERPGMFAEVHRDVRRVLLRSFPYAVYYRRIGDEVVVVAVLHLKRHPRTSQGRR